MKRTTSKLVLRSGSAFDLDEHLPRLEIVVPGRGKGKGRTSDHVELYSLLQLLRSPAIRAELDFPIEIIHRDRPDFLIRTADGLIGIEHVEAVSQNEALIASLREEGYGPEVHFIRRSVPGEPLLTREEAIREIEANEPGDGWCGNSPEKEWAAAMAYFIAEKGARMRKPGFETFDQNWLLVYDNWRVPGLDPRRALTEFLGLEGADDLLSATDRVYVVDDQWLWELSRSGTVTTIRDKAS